MDELGYGSEYRYAHDEPEAYAAGETIFHLSLKIPFCISLSRVVWNLKLPKTGASARL